MLCLKNSCEISLIFLILFLGGEGTSKEKSDVSIVITYGVEFLV